MPIPDPHERVLPDNPPAEPGPTRPYGGRSGTGSGSVFQRLQRDIRVKPDTRPPLGGEEDQWPKKN